ncbi:MAG: iron-sulfur cluster assembly scaffold protein [Saprospiraceae bacterium]
MSMDWDDENLDKLYHKVIRIHDQNPYKYLEKDQGKEAPVMVNNPMCGDRYKLWVAINRDRVEVGGFYGYGCSISKAAGSVLLNATDGQSKELSIALLRLFLAFIEEGEVALLAQLDKTLVQEILAFGGVLKFPARKKCAELIARGYLEWLIAQD